MPVNIHHLLFSHTIFIPSKLILGKEEAPPIFHRRRRDRPFYAIRGELHDRRRTTRTATRRGSRTPSSGRNTIMGAPSGRDRRAEADVSTLLPRTICTNTPPYKNNDRKTTECSADANDGVSTPVSAVGSQNPRGSFVEIGGWHG